MNLAAGLIWWIDSIECRFFFLASRPGDLNKYVHWPSSLAQSFSHGPRTVLRTQTTIPEEKPRPKVCLLCCPILSAIHCAFCPASAALQTEAYFPFFIICISSVSEYWPPTHHTISNLLHIVPSDCLLRGKERISHNKRQTPNIPPPPLPDRNVPKRATAGKKPSTGRDLLPPVH